MTMATMTMAAVAVYPKFHQSLLLLDKVQGKNMAENGVDQVNRQYGLRKNGYALLHNLCCPSSLVAVVCIGCSICSCLVRRVAIRYVAEMPSWIRATRRVDKGAGGGDDDGCGW